MDLTWGYLVGTSLLAMLSLGCLLATLLSLVIHSLRSIHSFTSHSIAQILNRKSMTVH